MCAVLYVHMDNLKQINMTMGREHGNRILQAFAHKLDACVRSADNLGAVFGTRLSTHLARTSGDKFTVFIGPLDNPQQAAVLARRIIIESGESHRIEGQALYTGAKVGIAVYPDDAADAQTLINNAETAMLHARAQDSGENLAFYSQEMNCESGRLLAIENGLRDAIEKQELRVTYQPKVDVNSGRIIGAEALMLKQIHNSDMSATVKKILAETGLPAHCLTLELTENMVMENAESNIDLLRQLKDQGISLSIDDFGTGYSSLSYLQKFPLDELKIDRSFIEVLETQESEAPVVRAMVSLAHDLGMRVVAEGIETDIQRHHIRQLSCELYQGYLCSKPVVAEAFSQLLVNDSASKAA